MSLASLLRQRMAGAGPFPLVLLLLPCVALATTTPRMLEPTRAVQVVWPVVGHLTSDFGPRWGRNHGGIDIGAPTGTMVGSVATGVVIWASERGNYGFLVELDHGQGWTSRYAHLDAIEVELGELLEVGEQLGTVGSTGNATGPHLHLEVRLDGRSIDPFEVLP